MGPSQGCLRALRECRQQHLADPLPSLSNSSIQFHVFSSPSPVLLPLFWRPLPLKQQWREQAQFPAELKHRPQSLLQEYTRSRAAAALKRPPTQRTCASCTFTQKQRGLDRYRSDNRWFLENAWHELRDGRGRH